jgi:hypothetical protein
MRCLDSFSGNFNGRRPRVNVTIKGGSKAVSGGHRQGRVEQGFRATSGSTKNQPFQKANIRK